MFELPRLTLKARFVNSRTPRSMHFFSSISMS
jgi:hypothetical protein